MNAKPIQRCKPKQEGSLRYRIWQLCTSSYFEFCIMVMIALNTCVLMAKVKLILIRKFEIEFFFYFSIIEVRQHIMIY